MLRDQRLQQRDQLGHVHLVELSIATDKRDILDKRLRDQEAIEWIAVVKRQARLPLDVIADIPDSCRPCELSRCSPDAIDRRRESSRAVPFGVRHQPGC